MNIVERPVAVVLLLTESRIRQQYGSPAEPLIAERTRRSVLRLLIRQSLLVVGVATANDNPALIHDVGLAVLDHD